VMISPRIGRIGLFDFHAPKKQSKSAPKRPKRRSSPSTRSWRRWRKPCPVRDAAVHHFMLRCALDTTAPKPSRCSRAARRSRSRSRRRATSPRHRSR
jgi:hypothetical protein